MSTFVPFILVSGLVSFISTPLVRRLAQRVNFVDNPQARKMHITPMPMLGGIAIYLGLMASVVLTQQSKTYIELLGIVLGATVTTLFGLWDDRVELSPAIKLVGQALATGILIATGTQVHVFDSEVLNIALTMFWVLGIVNAINFQDNMDGLAAGLATVASTFFFVLAASEGLFVVALLAAALLGACIGFLYYNFNPASLFMGDAGSMLIGFMLAVLGIKLTFSGRPLAATWMIPIIILGVPIFDTTLVVISRLRRGKHVYQGGKDHTSHRLVSILGMSSARSVMTLYLIAGMLGLVALMLRDASIIQARLLLAGLAALFVGALVWVEVKFKEPAKSTPAPHTEPGS